MRLFRTKKKRKSKRTRSISLRTSNNRPFVLEDVGQLCQLSEPVLAIMKHLGLESK